MSPSALLGGSFLTGAGGGEDTGKVSIRRHNFTPLLSATTSTTPNLYSLTPQFLLGKKSSAPLHKQLCDNTITPKGNLGAELGMLEHF